MGKYMRKGKGAGKVALMEVSQGSLGVRTRAKTLALVEQDRKLALARTASPKHQQGSVVDHPFHTAYLELRSRKLEKVVKENEKPVSGHASREDSLNEDDSNLSKAEGITTVDEVVCTTRPGREDSVWHAEVVGSSRTLESSPTQADGFRIFKDFPIESALSTPRATLDGAQLRCSESAAVEEPLRSGSMPFERRSEEPNVCMAVQGVSPPTEDDLSPGEVNCGRPEVEASCEYAVGELGVSSARRFLRGSPVDSASKDRDAVSDIDPASATRTDFLRQDRRMANHHRIMNRRYMRTNLFSDAKAIDELFAAPDNTDSEQRKRFTERYNYDVVNDRPLKGRYEWVPAAETRNTTTSTTEQLTDEQQQQSVRRS